jgi:hypothetical protein
MRTIPDFKQNGVVTPVAFFHAGSVNAGEFADVVVLGA